MAHHEDLPGQLPAQGELKLGLDGFTYADLFDPVMSGRLLARFMDDLEHRDPATGLRYRELLEAGHPTREDEAWVAMNVGPHVSRFLATLFSLDGAQEELASKTRALDVIYRVRREFVRRRVLKKVKPAALEGFDEQALGARVASLTQALGDARLGEHPELPFARMVAGLMDLSVDLASARDHDEGATELSETEQRRLAALRTKLPSFPDAAQVTEIKEAVEGLLGDVQQWAALQVLGASRPAATRDWVVFTLQQAFDYQDLVEQDHPREDLPELFVGPTETRRRRVGFTLTDRRMGDREVLGEVEVCIYCHEQQRDTCRHGILDKKAGESKKNPLGIVLDGCPLDEHISEANLLRQRGDALAALAVVMINNAMVPGTGHRICNDCMKACIYQKQDPVNIPQIETAILTDVLGMPWGPEVYQLLTRWNPLNVRRPYQLPLNGKKVLVVGLGPAGYTLAHYLTQEGFGVVAVDGLKLEPLPPELAGPDFGPIESWEDFIEPLDERRLDGFGGVSEYGITVRWDKNFLRLLYVTLTRKRGFKAIGGVRFGGTVTLDDAAELGFDHVAVATGAGKPTVVWMKNNLIRGVRKASDFLMALQLTGASKEDSLANLQVSLPAVVIGGGLTAIDTATELQAYYPVMVERVLARTELLESEGRLEGFLERLRPEEKETYEEFMAHGRAVREEKRRASEEGREADLVSLVQGWGGVTIAYRKTLLESPAYRLNHEEVIKALEEGIFFIENISPSEVVPDEGQRISSLKLKRRDTDDEIELPCRSLMVAAGTSPNVIYEKEHPGTFEMDGKFFKPHEARQDGAEVELVSGGDPRGAFFTSYNKDGLTVSYYGDNHPAYAGNVVKAMASARNGYPLVVDLFRRSITGLDPAQQPLRDRNFRELVDRMDRELVARVERVVRLTPTITEVVLHAPYQARRFQPGQFYRLQNFEANAPRVRGITLSMEGIALTGAWVDKDKGLLSLIILEMGGSSNLCAILKPGERVVCMGPTGAPTEIPKKQKVILAGGGLGNAVLFSIAKAMRAAGSEVLYFAGYKAGEDLFKREDIEEATDQVIFSTDTGAEIEPHRPQDSHIRANIIEAMMAYARGDLGDQVFPLKEATHLIAIGSDRMMAAIKAARHDPERLGAFMGHHEAIASINSPMQCMMKEVCAQCLQKHIDPETGEEFFVFSCFNQDQKMDEVDFPHLNLRLNQNGVLEKLAASTISLLLDECDVARI